MSARRRSFVLIFVPVFVLFVFTALMESDKMLHALDDEIIVVVSLVALVYIAISRHVTSATDLARVNRFMVVVAAVIALAGVLAVALEFTDANDIADDPLTIVGGALAVVNGLLVLSIAGAKSPAESTAFATEWSRVRATFWFSSFFLVTFVVGVIPPYPAFGVASALGFAELALLLVFGVLGILFLSRIRTESDPVRLRTFNNVLLVVAVLLTAVAVAEFDVFTLAFSVMLIANRFL